MLAAQVLGGERVQVIEVPDPVPAAGQVLVRLEVSLLCGSEMHGYRGDKAQATNGGHEPAGVVVDASGSRRWRMGDRVGIHAVWGCGQCEWCARGIYTFCSSFRGCPGAHAGLMACPDHVLLPLPDDVDFEVGALLAGDGLGVPYHTSQRLRCRGGDTVVVVGCGPIGLGNILVQSFRGARVIAIDRVADRLAMAREVGAAETVDASAVDPLEAIQELTAGRLAEGVVEATGVPAGFALALKLVGKAGTVACCGENRDVTLNVGNDLIRRDITVFGSWFFHFREFPEMLDLYRRGLAVGKLVTHRYPLARIGEAYADFAAGRVGKPAILVQS
ncbi:MAG: zinc-binding dehydrogenase [Fimbriimonadaceae bacterium]|nr:zinc-binding dehydrogenase [Fimbriimonadaceae bacterium]